MHYALLLFCATLAAHAGTLAFPGAEGFGALATGGRGCEIYHVTTLTTAGRARSAMVKLDSAQDAYKKVAAGAGCSCIAENAHRLSLTDVKVAGGSDSHDGYMSIEEYPNGLR